MSFWDDPRFWVRQKLVPRMQITSTVWPPMYHYGYALTDEEVVEKALSLNFDLPEPPTPSLSSREILIEQATPIMLVTHFNNELRKRGVSFRVGVHIARSENLGNLVCFTIANTHQARDPLAKFKKEDLDAFEEVMGFGGAKPKWYMDFLKTKPTLRGAKIRRS